MQSENSSTARSNLFKSLAGDSAIYGIGTILTRGFNLIALPLFARILGRDEFGLLDVVYLYALFVGAILGLQISQGVIRFWYDDSCEVRRRKLASVGFWVTVLTWLPLVLVAFLFGEAIAVFLFDDIGRTPLIYAACAYYIAFNLFGYLQIFPRMYRRAWMFVSSALLNVFLNLAFGLVALVYFDAGVVGLVLAFALSALCAGLLLAPDYAPLMLSRPDPRGQWPLFAFILPLIPMAFAAWLMMQAGRVVYQHAAPIEIYADYAFSARIASFPMLLFAGVQMAVGPLIYGHLEHSDTSQRVSQFFGNFVLLAAVGVGAVMLFAPEVVDVMGGAKYASAVPLVAPLVTATTLLNLYIFNPGFSIAKRSDLQLYYFALLACASVLCFYAALKNFGIDGLVIAQVALSIAFIVGWFIWSGHYFAVRVDLTWGLIFPLAILVSCFGFAQYWPAQPWAINALVAKTTFLILVCLLSAWVAIRKVNKISGAVHLP